MPIRCELRDQIRAPRLIGDQDRALVADALGRDVLVGARVLGQRRGMNARLGREGRGADIGRVPVRRAVEQFVEACARCCAISRSASGVTPISNRSAESCFSASVGISETRLALPQRSPRPLSVPCTCRDAGADRGERIGDRVVGVVMGVDAEPLAGDDARDLARRCARPRRAACRRWCRKARPSARPASSAARAHSSA